MVLIIITAPFPIGEIDDQGVSNGDYDDASCKKLETKVVRMCTFVKTNLLNPALPWPFGGTRGYQENSSKLAAANLVNNEVGHVDLCDKATFLMLIWRWKVEYWQPFHLQMGLDHNVWDGTIVQYLKISWSPLLRETYLWLTLEN